MIRNFEELDSLKRIVILVVWLYFIAYNFFITNNSLAKEGKK